MDSNISAALTAFFEAKTSGLYTSIPCKVVSVDSSTQARVSVIPLVNLVSKTEDVSFERPTILGVPLQLPACETAVVHIPVKQGDIVLCVFSMRGLDAFKSGDGTPSAPTDFRMFDKRDAIAIPGIFPFAMHPNAKRALPFNPDALSLTANIGTPLEATVELSETSIKLQMGATSIEVTPLGVNITGVLTINGVPFLLHNHSGVTTGPGVSGPVVV